jgi:guanine deaminase
MSLLKSHFFGIFFDCSQFLVPGLVDTHIHAPQYVNSGVGYDRQLLDWLDTYTFPTEASFSDIQVAKDVYPKVVVCMYVHVSS